MEDILRGFDAVAEGQHRGVMGPFLLPAAAHFHDLYLTIAVKLPYAPEATQ